MRTVTYGAGCSLDGFIADPDDGVAWLRWSADVQRISAEFWSTIDTVVMGRRTYEVAAASGTRAYPGVRNVVFSQSLDPSLFPEVEMDLDAVGTISRLKQEEGKGIAVMGGGVLASSLLSAGLLDEIGVNIHPLLLGAGVPLLAGSLPRSQLRLKRYEPLEGGCVYALYEVAAQLSKVLARQGRSTNRDG